MKYRILQFLLILGALSVLAGLVGLLLIDRPDWVLLIGVCLYALVRRFME